MKTGGVEMVSLAAHQYGGNWLKPGDVFVAEERFVPVLTHLGRAKIKASEGDPGPNTVTMAATDTVAAAQPKAPYSSRRRSRSA